MDRRRFVKSLGCANTISSVVHLPVTAKEIFEKTYFSSNCTNFIDDMSCVVLDKEKSFASQVMQEKTIYEIRYVFDLKNEREVNIPSDCILKFEGGMLKNGHIKGNRFEIFSNRVCLKNVTFSGDVAISQKFFIDWWVSQYGYKIEENPSYDSSPEIMDAVLSGVKNLVFSSEKFYYLKESIKVDGYVNLYSDHEIREFDSTYRGTGGHLPCIYSNEIVNLLDYNFRDDDKQRNSVTIGHINFYCRKKYSDLSEKEVPIMSINSQSSLWGLSINANINAVDWDVDGIHVCNYTGLLLKSGAGSMSYVKVNGYIQMCHYCIRTERGENWFTDLTINGDTRGCIGGVFNAGVPVRIFGSHQPTYIYKDVAETYGYFNGNWINLYGFVWDTNVSKDGLKTVYKPVVMTKEDFFFNSELGDTTIGRPIGALLRVNDIMKYSTGGNLLEILQDNGIENLSYTLNDVDINAEFEEGVLYNSYNIFNNGNLIATTGNNGNSSLYSDLCFFVANKNINYKLKIEFDIIADRFEYRELSMLSLYIKHSQPFSVTLFNGKAEKKYSYAVAYDEIYSLNRVFECKIPYSQSNTRVLLEFDFRALNGAYTGLPIVFMPMIRPFVPYVKSITIDKRPRIHPSFKRVIPFFDTTLNKPIWWNGNNWVDATGKIV